jgi:alpha-galactosidase
MRVQSKVVASILLAAFLFKPAAAAPLFQQTGNTLVMSNADVLLEYHLNAGTTDFYWQNSKKISAFYSGVGLSTGYIKGISYSSWSYAVNGSNQVIVTATGSGLPMMKQYFTLDQNDSFLVQVAMVGTNLSANWMGPVVVDTTGWVNIGITNDNCALVVPFDNDGFVTYDAMPMNSSGIGYEVGAFYDNTSRNGLVVGSVTHDTWKTGIFFDGANNQLSLLNVFGGATSPWDVMPHGSVAGNVISSPTVFVGFGADWRVTMQNFAAENTHFAPRLAWTNGVPFGWNSWGILQTNINYTNAIAVSDYFFVNLMNNNFNDNGTVYINLDSFWNNLSDSQLQSFVSHCHAHGEKTGIYFGPFTYWGTAAQGSNTLITGSSNYYWSDTYLRTTNGGVQTVDDGIALDPTHPGTKECINYYINLFTNWGFDYVKLDFLSHGALEGVHYDTNVTTGIQAYNQGMQYVLNAVNGRMFMSESIAPLFPYQYGHSRRIACDAYTSLISNTEYTMNSVSYGWWLDNLYQFNDPDIMVFNGYGTTTNENQSRLISGAVTGIFLDGDDVTTANGQSAAQEMLTNPAMDDVARVGQTFTPVEGNTGTNAANIFVRQDGATWCIAVFNYTSSAANETVNLSRAGLPPGNYSAINLWDGTTTVASGSLNVSLNAGQSKLFQLTAYSPANLRWSASNNDGVWDTDNSANWINLANSQQTVFNTSDQVLFDDTVGVPANVTVNGTVSPGIVTVNSSTNNFTFNGSGSISGSGGLVKEGSSTLTIVSPANFTGPVTISGGAIYAGDYSFASVSSITITNNATLDFGGSPLNGGKPITVSGTGVNGEGALYNSSYVLYDQTLDITLTGNTTFGAASGGGSRWDLGHGSTLTGPYKVTINFPGGGYGEWDTVAIATNVGNFELAQGSWGLKGLGAGMGNPTNTLTVDSGTTLDIWNSSYGPTDGYNINIHVLTNGTFQILTGFDYFNANMTLENDVSFNAYYGSGNQSMNGAFTLNGIVHFVLGDANFVFTNVISGSGGFVWDAYNHEMVLQAANTYAGPTVIGGGLTLALSGSGSIADSALIFFGGSNPTNNSLDVSGRSDQTLTLASGQTLAGIGGINGSLAVSPGATLSPSGTNVTLGITEGSSSTGTIVVSNAITLNGTTVLKLNGSGINDKVQSGAGITYGGTLSLVNISGSPLANGNSFHIFSAASYAGSFASITPATPGPSLAWGTSQLNIGVLNVVPEPIINSVAVSAGNLIFSGTNGTASGTFYVLTTTNVAAPLTNWVTLSTNSFNANGTFSVTNAIAPGTPQRFYCIRPQ